MRALAGPAGDARVGYYPNTAAVVEDRGDDTAMGKA
jgi:hypothetical protein